MFQVLAKCFQKVIVNLTLFFWVYSKKKLIWTNSVHIVSTYSLAHRTNHVSNNIMFSCQWMFIMLFSIETYEALYVEFCNSVHWWKMLSDAIILKSCSINY